MMLLAFVRVRYFLERQIQKLGRDLIDGNICLLIYKTGLG
jgi:hypothetical protein